VCLFAFMDGEGRRGFVFVEPGLMAIPPELLAGKNRHLARSWPALPGPREGASGAFSFPKPCPAAGSVISPPKTADCKAGLRAKGAAAGRIPLASSVASLSSPTFGGIIRGF
jgi:hypothetical protein